MRIHLNQSTASVCLPLLLSSPSFFPLLLSPVETNEGGGNPAANASLLDGSATEAAFSAARLPEFLFGRGRLCIFSLVFFLWPCTRTTCSALPPGKHTVAGQQRLHLPNRQTSSERITQGDKSPAAFASPGSATRRVIYTHARTHAHTPTR